MADQGTVLVTGGSGYIGGWCIVALLERGYRVKTTIRNLAREAEVRAWLAKAVEPGDRLSFYAADLMSDAGWDAAAEGCDYVLHVASPIAVAEPKDPDELIVPAREGAKRAVNAAIKAGVKRVVLTSSVAATSQLEESGDSVSDETRWTDVTDPKLNAYGKSKTLAERAAWDLVAEKGGAMTLATVNPALVIGPVLGKDFSGSIQLVERLVAGRLPGLPRLGWNVVDVRDVADLHIRAMLDPAAAGERFVAAGAWVWMAEVAALLKANLGEAARKTPTRKVPDFVVHLMGLFDKDIAGVASGLGKKHDFSSAKAQRVLGWRPRPTNETLLDCARSLIAVGAV
jgi:nucleoside-diphosphate-sugar epimerase